MYYKILGYLNHTQLKGLRDQLDQQYIRWNEAKTWDYAAELAGTVSDLIGPQPLSILPVPDKQWAVKLFRTLPGQNAPIHKDGLRARSALNICVDSNPGDWIRWWSDDIEQRFEKNTVSFGEKGLRHSRNLDAGLTVNVAGWCEEFRPLPGCVYAINTDIYHSYHCSGPVTRRVIQTKFQGWPTFAQLTDLLVPSLFQFSTKI